MTIDTNVHLGPWPFRHHGHETPDRLVAKLKSVGIEQAWIASFEGIFHKDVAGANARLADNCKKHPMLVPFGTVNPRLPDWLDDVRRCRDVHGMAGIRLYPSYHGYKLDEAEFGRLLATASKAGLLVQLVVQMEDERTHHPLMRVPAVDLGPLPKAVSATPDLRLQILNCSIPAASEQLLPIVRSGQVVLDIAMQEGVGAVGRLVDRVGRDRVCFGTHFPLFHAESSVLKLKEAALPAATEKAVRAETAQGLLRRK